MNWLAKAAFHAINWYQQELSPRKGFCCAYRVYHGDVSCSNKIKQTIESQGLGHGLYSAFAQARQCRAAAVCLAEKSKGPIPEETREKHEKSCNNWALGVDIASECCFLPFW
jgi:putative component of membrane protein insertase Oxa1/YidC/SpoIIIJ protein YidD